MAGTLTLHEVNRHKQEYIKNAQHNFCYPVIRFCVREYGWVCFGWHFHGKNTLCGFRSHFIRNSLRILYPVRNDTNFIGRPSYQEKVNTARRYFKNISNRMGVQISEMFTTCLFLALNITVQLCVWILALLVTLDKSCCIISDSQINICLVWKGKRMVSKKNFFKIHFNHSRSDMFVFWAKWTWFTSQQH